MPPRPAIPDPVATASERPLTAAAWGVLLVFPLLKLALHVAAGTGYGYFRDELYYLACADHLDWGYVDHPPLSIALLAAWRALFGDGILALRAAAALLGAAAVGLTGLLTWRLGGGLFALALAMLATISAPTLLALNGFYSMNALELPLWLLAFHQILTLLRRETQGAWLLLGLLCGVGLLNKLSMGWLVGGLGLGLLLTPFRGRLLTAGPWLALATAGAIFAPHLIWQAAHDWPTPEFVANARKFKMVPVSPWEFVGQQIQAFHPLLVPLWLGGAFRLWRRPGGDAERVFFWIWAAVALLLLSSGASRPYYLAPLYPLLFAAGATALSVLLRARPARALRGGILAFVALTSIPLLPLTLPILSVDDYVRYAAAIGFSPRSGERTKIGRLPQHYADRQGWPELAATMAEVYQGLPAAERGEFGIFCANYGQAGAIQVLGRRLGLPRPISGHNSYWLWGRQGVSGEKLIVYGAGRDELVALYDSVQTAAVVECRDCMPYETNRPIFVCRGLRRSFDDEWADTKVYR